MVNYLWGVICGVSGGIANFSGQILMKKAINETPRELKEQNLLKTLLHNRTWISGLLIMVFLSVILLTLTQAFVGGALIPGLTASGLIVLGIGSVKILGEHLKSSEIAAIATLIVAIAFIGFSQLSIEASLSYFEDAAFTRRIILWTLLSTACWWGCIGAGRLPTRFRTLLLSFGAGIPFVLSNIWLQPLIVAMQAVFGGTAGRFEWTLFIFAAIIQCVVNVLGLGQFQFALNAGNASLVVPIQQLPQQLAPIFIYYFIYMFPSPTSYSLSFLIIGISLITLAGFILANRQAALEKIH